MIGLSIISLRVGLCKLSTAGRDELRHSASPVQTGRIQLLVVELRSESYRAFSYDRCDEDLLQNRIFGNVFNREHWVYTTIVGLQELARHSPRYTERRTYTRKL